MILVSSGIQVSYANEFYTIIGPDGRPMIVQQKTKPKAKIPVVSSVQEKQPVLRAEQSDIFSDHRLETSSVADGKRLLEITPISEHNIVPDSPLKNSQQSVVIASERIAPTVVKPAESIAKQVIEDSIISHQPLKSTQSSSVETPMVTSTKTTSASSMLDEQEYINSEYLEQREFNIEGKKRFYAMPEGVIDGKAGTTRMQMIEREKGIGKSVLQSLFQREQVDHSVPFVLSPFYHRVAKEDAIHGLGQECFSGKKIKKAKILAVSDQVNIWPRAALKNEFDFEVIQLKQPVQNIQIRSYASKGQSPTFYWPFVVFLDEKACVLEGAGGYKNQDYQANVLQHETIEGILQIPEKTNYILLTPLASAIDVDERHLSNQGQLKLIAIR